MGLKPIARRVWSPKGQRPRSCGRTRYQWLYLYGFVRPKTGQTFGVLLPRVKAQRMSEALAEFAAHADPKGEKGGLTIGPVTVNLIQRSRMLMPNISHANIKSLVSRIESGATVPRLDLARKIAEIFDKTVDEVFPETAWRPARRRRPSPAAVAEVAP